MFLVFWSAISLLVFQASNDEVVALVIMSYATHTNLCFLDVSKLSANLSIFSLLVFCGIPGQVLAYG